MDEKHQQLVADYLQGSLSTADKQLLEELLASGEINFMDFRTTEELYEELQALAVPQAGSRMRENFYQMLEAEKEANQSRFGLRLQKFMGVVKQEMKPLRVAVAALLLMIGGLTGFLLNGSNTEIEQLTAEMRDMRQMVMVAMLEGPSTTDRLKAVNISSQLNRANEQAITALTFTLNNDPSVNVRVQAIEALKKWGDQELVRRNLVSAITKQDSPIVIIELADAMIELELKTGAGELQKWLNGQELNISVQQKLQQSIAALS